MSTALKAASKLPVSEAKTLEKFDVISPLVETSSSTATVVSTTAQVSSKSSSPFNAVIFEESSKLSPLSEEIFSPSEIATATNCAGSTIVGDSITKQLIKSPISSGARSPIGRHLLPFLNETYHNNNKQQIQKRNTNLKNRCENMLSMSGNNNQQLPAANTAGRTGSSPTNSIKNIKCEPYSTLSPLNDSAANQSMLDEAPNNNGGGVSNNVAMDSTVKRERDCPTNSTSASTSMMRQNSNGSVKSCTNTGNASSPNNGSDHSDSSNISSSITKAIDSTSDILQDQNNPDKVGNKKKTSLNSLTVKEEENGVKSLDKSTNLLTAPSSKNLLCTTPTINSLSIVKDETDVMNNLIKVKKEEGNVSPEMSPAGFGSIANLSGSSSVEVRSCTPVKLDDVSNTKAINNSNNNGTNSNSNNDKLASVLSSINNNGPSGCAEDVPVPVSSLANVSGDACIGGTHHPSANMINNSSNSGGSIANCMEYMQQQNHIFVFSTQLANKGAESVLSGQFPTIIAYHCTQPATKNFLEDFFMKNPMKISKLQRQNTLNLCNISVGAGGQQWIGGCNSVPKMSQKPNGNKINFTGLSGSLDSKASLRQPNITSFPDVPEALGGSENDLMCWEQSRNSLEGAANEGQTGMKIPNGVDGIIGGSHVTGGSHAVGNKPLGAPDTNVANDNGTPSLQGIKVPDENLTPQQRQHREEQLAKLKQIDQFLSNPLQGTNQLSKLGADSVPGNLAGLMLNLPNSSPAGMVSQMINPLNPNMRNMPPHVMNSSNQNICNPENMSTALADGNMVSTDIMGTHEMNNVNKSMQSNTQPNIQCGSNGVIGAVSSNVSAGNMPRNSLSCHSGGSNSGGGAGGSGNISTPGLMPNSPEMMSNFIADGNLNSSVAKLIGPGGMHPQEIGQVGMAQMEWSKLQHQFFEERIKNKGQGANDIGCMPATLCRSNSTSMGNASLRANMLGTCVSTTTTNSSQTIRSAQGPPPPYHPTQRSASVPIATQSPNPASPNNPTSNLSLPSPRTSGALGIPANSPNMDVHVSTMSTTLGVTTTTSTVTTAISNTNAQGKNNFQPEGSPTTSTANTNNNTTNNNRSRNNQINQFNSNPSTPSHLSPKDLESFHPSAPAGDLKNARPSPQRSRTPLMGSNNGSIADAGNMEGRFPPASPGLNFPQHIQNASNSGVNNYKGPGPIERQNSAPVASQFCRRTDNLPLNPNSNRSGQNKLNHSFDPISSLAQMSQQLTSCVSLNTGGGGNSAGVGNMGVIGVNDVNVPNNINQNMDTMMGSIDSGLDHCNAGSSGNMGMPPHMSGPGPFMSNNCHINTMLGPMGQRLLNPKMCGGFNPTNGGMGRDGPGGLHGVIPTHRMMGRVAMNFGSFNVSPNIQVKASTPNTIQYMPVRPQTNNNSNMRVPPSLEFLRYANPQISGTGNIMDNTHIGQGITGPPSDPNKISNCSSGPGVAGNAGMNFFGNCNQMGSMVGDQEDMVAGNLIAGHEMGMGPHMIRGMRPIRQQHMGHSTNQMIPGPRMQAPGVPVMPGHFANGQQDPMECGDASMFIANNPNANGPVQGPTQSVPGQSQMYAGGNSQQKPVKSLGASNICQNMNAPSLGNNGQLSANGNLLPNEHNTSMPSAVNGPLMMGNNSTMLSNAMQVGNNASPVGCSGNGGNGPGDVGNVGYKPFVGPASNDIKYAQQYHSFQQQLYATSTRSQQNTGNSNIGANVSTNPTFFVNK
ncbi:PREDICTED: protein BCL9 homolog isoform X1 [Rhagoletis zephyria]|uniref:protein BCL9 homolog isoform X1 n=2 Tax=Rhagoletis zephyria TaxID=28612 RepID=UPI0008119899|nr:PREDICTED: protein BCL9 homolog isoform X1 [Rhagoletis zephyria]